MVGMLAVRLEESNKRLAEYQEKLNKMLLPELVKEFLAYLDYVDESESGREFHPITISCCRVLMSQPLSECLKRLRELSE